MAKRPSMPIGPVTLAVAGMPWVLQLIDVFERALLLACVVGRAVGFRVALLQERASKI